MNLKIVNGTILLYADGALKTECRDLYVKGNCISFVPFAESETYETYDAKHQLVMPGLINMHTHAYMTLMRNYADDVCFTDWLFNGVMPIEDKLPVEAAYWTNQLAFMEMIKTGTTSYVDMHMYLKQSGKAATETGMRAFIGRGLVGDDLYTDGYERFRQAIDELEEYQSETCEFILSPHAIYSGSTKLFQQVAEEAKKRGLLHQTHLSEGMTEINDCYEKYGKSPVALLNEIGFLDDECILAHCVQMRDDDIDILKATGSHVVTNPASNAKLGNGFAPISEMKEKGVNICIGTDGTASNNTLNMFREMGLLSLIHKGIQKDPTALPAQYVVQAATVNAAKALHKEDQLGVIKEGAAADLIFLDLRSPSLFPNNNIISSLCYSANGSEVVSSMINGKFVMRKNELLTIDTERVYYEVEELAKQFL